MFENRDTIAYLLRTGHVDGMPAALASLDTRKCVADDWLEALSISGAVVHIDLKLHPPFSRRNGYGSSFESFGIFIRPDVLGTC